MVRCLTILLSCLWLNVKASATEQPQYNRDVLPILAEYCFACHGFDSGQRQAGLRLDQRDEATATLGSGEVAIVPGNLEQSELWARVVTKDHDLQMPPVDTGKRLSNDDRETLKRWIQSGAEYEKHWAFLTPEKAQPPDVPGVGHSIDRFVRAKLQDADLQPSSPADRSVLIRRVTLNLIGLPPSPEEVGVFLEDKETGALERVVDRLLQSPHFGEHWARWWLDLAHYGDSDGYLQDFLRPVAWRYRQWVVDAFNADMPFDEFTIQQLAGDLLPDATVSQRMGTGFLRNTLSNREGGADLEEFRINQVLDRTMTVGTTWLGLTVGCAQCHDHKFDPVSQTEFYQLFAFFNNADEVNFNAPLPDEAEEYEAAREDYNRQRAALIAPVAEPLAALQAEWEKEILFAESNPGVDFMWDRQLELLGLQWGQNLGEGQLEGLNILRIPTDQRTKDQRNRLLDYFLASGSRPYSDRFAALKLSALREKLDKLATALPPVTRAPGMMKSVVHRPTWVHVRGDYRRHGDPVVPGTIAALPPMDAPSTPDRLELARWLVSPEHPLTARVTVNRLWQELFGRGIVATSENFGVRGDAPSHPQLLDWLAVDFVENGWSIKSLLREIVLSQTYRQSSDVRDDLAGRDPLNLLLARQTRLRLSGEAIRDSALAVSGLLSRKVGGPSVKPPQPSSVSKDGYNNTWEPSTGEDRYRRGLYTFLQRTSPYAQFVTFDLPDISGSCTRRERSNTPLQALTLLNDPVFMEAAQLLAIRILNEVPDDDEVQRIDRAYLLAFGRHPHAEEAQRLMEYLKQQRNILNAEAESAAALLENTARKDGAEWVMLSSVLLNLDEFIHRE
jgi:hypothetical protein